MNWTATIERYIAEGRTVSGGKGDPAIKEQEQQQQAFNTQLQQTFSQQFGKQSGILNFLNQKLTNQVNNPQGFTPAQMAALNTNNRPRWEHVAKWCGRPAPSRECHGRGGTRSWGIQSDPTGKRRPATAKLLECHERIKRCGPARKSELLRQ